MIARSPESGELIGGNLYVLETFSFLNEDEYVFIYYTIDDDDTCTLRWIARGSDVVAGEHTLVDLP